MPVEVLGRRGQPPSIGVPADLASLDGRLVLSWSSRVGGGGWATVEDRATGIIHPLGPARPPRPTWFPWIGSERVLWVGPRRTIRIGTPAGGQLVLARPHLALPPGGTLIGAARADRFVISGWLRTVVVSGEGRVLTRLWRAGAVAGFREDAGAVALVGWDDEVGPAMRFHDLPTGEVVEAVALADIDASLASGRVQVVPEPGRELVHLRAAERGEWIQVRLIRG